METIVHVSMFDACVWSGNIVLKQYADGRETIPVLVHFCSCDIVKDAPPRRHHGACFTSKFLQIFFHPPLPQLQHATASFLDFRKHALSRHVQLAPRERIC
jgi:hypothetical protein